MAEGVADSLFEQTPGGPRLVGGRCVACEHHGFPFREICTYCGAAGVERVHLSRCGTLWGWTAVASAPPGYQGPVPYGFGVVELPEGVRVIGRLTEPDPERLAFGQPMATVIDEIDGFAVYAFAPDGQAT